MSALIPLEGRRFGRLEVLRRAGNVRHPNGTFGEALWLCRCDCGAEREMPSRGLRRGRSASCGCAKVRHGHARHGAATVEYTTWVAMRDRCENSKARNFADYGGRGITVCDRWRADFAAFLADMGPRPSPKHSIDRRDNSRGYSPDNCRWATRVEQARNKRNNHLITFRGETRPISEWSEIMSIRKSTIRERLRRGWTEEQSLRQVA